MTLDLKGKHCPVIFSAVLFFIFKKFSWTSTGSKCALRRFYCLEKQKLSLERTPPGKKLHLCIRYLWKRKEKPANLNRGVCFSMKWKATCQNWAHLDEGKKFGLKSHLWASCTKPFSSPTAHISNTALSLLHNKYSVCENTANLEHFEFQVVKVIAYSSTGRRWALFWHRLCCYCVTFRHA